MLVGFFAAVMTCSAPWTSRHPLPCTTRTCSPSPPPHPGTRGAAAVKSGSWPPRSLTAASLPARTACGAPRRARTFTARRRTGRRRAGARGSTDPGLWPCRRHRSTSSTKGTSPGTGQGGTAVAVAAAAASPAAGPWSGNLRHHHQRPAKALATPSCTP